MTVSVDYTQLDQPPVRLTLARIPGGYQVHDQHGQPWTLGACTLEFCLRLMKAAREKRDAVVDDASVEMVTWQAAQEFSVRVPSNVVPIRKGA